MKAALLYPPFMDPRAPQLALPSLAAALRPNSVAVSMHDLALIADARDGWPLGHTADVRTEPPRRFSP
jgi:hypothetical protein